MLLVLFAFSAKLGIGMCTESVFKNIANSWYKFSYVTIKITLYIHICKVQRHMDINFLYYINPLNYCSVYFYWLLAPAPEHP